MKKRTKGLIEEALSMEEGDPKKLIADCERVRELPPWGGEEMERMHLSYTWAPPPGRGRGRAHSIV